MTLNPWPFSSWLSCLCFWPRRPQDASPRATVTLSILPPHPASHWFLQTINSLISYQQANGVQNPISSTKFQQWITVPRLLEKYGDRRMAPTQAACASSPTMCRHLCWERSQRPEPSALPGQDWGARQPRCHTLLPTVDSIPQSLQGGLYGSSTLVSLHHLVRTSELISPRLCSLAGVSVPRPSCHVTPAVIWGKGFPSRSPDSGKHLDISSLSEKRAS